MMRRSRITVRPNVRSGGRGQATLQDSHSVPGSTNSSEDTAENEHKDLTDSTNQSPEVTNNVEAQSADAENITSLMSNDDNNSHPEKASCNGDGLDHNGSSNIFASSLVRRKRFSAMPNLTKIRVTPAITCTSARGPRSSSVKSGVVSMAETTAINTENQLRLKGSATQGFRYPSKQKACSEGAQPVIQSVPLSSTSQDPEGSLQGKKSKVKSLSRQSSQLSGCQKSLNEGVPGVEKALASECCMGSTKLSQGSVSLVKAVSSVATLTTKTQSVPSDHERIIKAQKLRELLKRQRKKERKHKKGKSRIFECSSPQDHSKMTMADLIYYLPETNPMKSYLMEEPKQNEKESSWAPTKQVAEQPQEAEEEDDVENGDEQDEQLVVPRVKVAEDGSLIIDEESLTVEVLRVQGPNMVEEKDPIFERGSSTTYSSFRKASYTKPWSNKETDMFFLAISMVGTDFSMIGQLFPHRSRSEIKNKFKKEERTNSCRIDKAFREKRRFDLSFFSSLLERILAEEQKKQEKSKVSAEKQVSRKPRSKQKVPDKTKASVKGSTNQTAEEEMDSVGVEGDLETAEKENEDCSNFEAVEETTTSQRRAKKMKKGDTGLSSPEKVTDERHSSNEGEAMNRDASDVITEVSADGDVQRSERPDSCAERWKRPVIKPAQISRGRFQKPVPNLGWRGDKKISEPKEKTSDDNTTTCEEDKEYDGHKTKRSALAGKRTREAKRTTQVLTSDDEEQASKAEEELSVTARQEHMLNRPTRSGRIPKMSQALQQAGDEDSAEEPSPVSETLEKTSPQHPCQKPPGSNQRKAKPTVGSMPQRSRKSKLVTLRASLPEGPVENRLSEARPDEVYSYPTNPEEQNQVPAFVPLSLRSPEPKRLEVEETMEELEILVNVPDALSTIEPEDVLCHPSESQGPRKEVPVLPEYQLGVFGGMMKCLSLDHVEVSKSEESCNEAARTLLTIRNPEILSLPLSMTVSETIDKEAKVGTQVASEQEKETQCSPQTTSTMTPGSPGLGPSRLAGLDTVLEPQNSQGRLPKREEPCPRKGVQNRAGRTSCAEAKLDSIQSTSPPKKSHFQKPNPNLALASRPASLWRTQSTVTMSSEKVEVAQSESNESETIFKNSASEESKNEGMGVENPKKSETSTPEMAQEAVVSSEPIAQSGPQSRRSRFPKPKPNLGRAVRNLRPTAQSPATRRTANDSKSSQETPANDKSRTDVEARMVPIAQTPAEQLAAARSPKILGPNETSVAEGEEPSDMPVDPDPAQEQAMSLHTGDSFTFNMGDSTEGVSGKRDFTHSEPTIILTLFEIPPTSVNEYKSGSAPVGAVTAELLSPLVFIDAQSEPQSSEAVAMADAEVPGAGSPLSHFMVSEPLHHLTHCSTVYEEHSSSAVLKESRSLDKTDEEEENVSLSLVSVEELNEAPEEDDDDDDGPPQKKWKMPIKSKKGKPKVKPGSLKRASVEPTKDASEESKMPPQILAFPKEDDLAMPSAGAQHNPPAKHGGALGDPLLQARETPLGSSGEREPQHHVAPLTLDKPLIRPGRKPKGFLSFMSNKTTTGPAGTSRTSRPALQVNTSCIERRKASLQAAMGCPREPPAINTPHSTTDTAASPSVSAHKMEPPEVSKSTEGNFLCVNPSDKTEYKKPTNVSEYFFGDIFTEVEEPD
ncbi:transcription factor TFIIIB component B'' homolog isoform X3 [Brienomyrus brachyistius]|uniref:transcription factor TFIIIB component B'' homolog isoform X3 n=1 Tax=Brienomyrus brachyistius TaxID=42636 RepID=UPI0020B4498E|nr:transcription factor TFIIIB component B'' homolog isoform X3 [Brienomyrus brachyistius]